MSKKSKKQKFKQRSFWLTPAEFKLIRQAHGLAYGEPVYDYRILRFCGKIIVDYCQKLIAQKNRERKTQNGRNNHS